jgi:uncharacterized LabA/DUF88 family protein
MTDTIALFIDGYNFHATAKALGFEIDYTKLLRHFQSRGRLLRATYYTTLTEDKEFGSLRPMLDWLDYNGFTTVTKAAKEYTDPDSGRRRVKGDMDVELTIDALDLAPHITQMVLFLWSRAGDGHAAARRPGRRGIDHRHPAGHGGRRAAPASR